MKKNDFIQSVGYLSIVSLFVLTGCATQSTPPQEASAEAVSIAPAATDSSAPTMPPAVAAAPVIEVQEAPKQPEPEPEDGSVASIIKKMETSPYTLYWRGKNTYSYYVGGLIDAEYKPGEGLVVKAESPDDNGLTCKFDDNGSLSDAEKDKKMKEECSKLMFTLDSELSE